MASCNYLWRSPLLKPVLGSNDVHIWKASLEQPAECMQLLTQILSHDEQKRSKRFYFQEDARHFIACRGILRAILGYYLGREPQQLQFCYNYNGKPALGENSEDRFLHFNLSHSQGLALYAVTSSREIGIDLERIRNIPNFERIAIRFFSPEEYTILHDLPENQKNEVFFTYWTCKEAYVKALGRGLSVPFSQFDVSIRKEESVVLLNTKWNQEEGTRWYLHQLVPESNYVAAIAIESFSWRLYCWQWSSETVSNIFR